MTHEDAIGHKSRNQFRHVAKTVEDKVLGAIFVLLLAPVMLVIAIAIKVTSSGPIFFRQIRFGANQQLIGVLKFRTMYHNMADPNCEQQTQLNDPRVTPVGRFLRRYSLDELPQFFNVLAGDMSIVGPRPHALDTKANGILFTEAIENYHDRHQMKPGITGWAQVNGWRGETDTLEKLQKRMEYDMYYINNWSVGFDLKIILRTAIVVFIHNSY